ncbi:MAG: ERAP1-like C-terminal domain-containing protein [Rhodothermaceae bacterium]|nr:ERAP1-like C-terminal domain-containing protein [Rhodothermaceae bacterium]
MYRLLLTLIALAIASCAQTENKSVLYDQGVSWDLAEYRSSTLSDLAYDIHLQIPSRLDVAIQGVTTFHFTLSESTPDPQVIIDFNQPASSVLSVSKEGQPVPFELINNHIVITGIQPGRHAIEVAYIAGESSLNRNDDYLYTLFVPDRASFALPLFDQPNLKARYRLTLDIPTDWTAVANGPLEERIESDETATYSFKETAPISTYLFSFAAGIFQSETTERNGRHMTMYHRETDAEKVARNADVIFNLHYEALEWLEDYTGIDYPFDKFDFVLIPSFQYGGMEHPGAILYRASSLFLESSATQNQYLGRASLIAHETAHMWFGDLVTMNWFDDVWTKEVFANFMAAKIANPTFPDINHELRFLLRHYPGAYGIDRTLGANPIQQPLENLQMAGTLYGPIIYQKAPIVMRQLEFLIGEETLQKGLQQYLNEYGFANATWDNLIAILDDLSPEDLKSWSSTWIKEPGRPHIQTQLTIEDDAIEQLLLVQSDAWDKKRIWNQQLTVTLGYPDSMQHIPVQLDDPSVELEQAKRQPVPDFILPHSKGIGYGLFTLDPKSRAYLLENLHNLPAPLTRGIAWLTLWDEVLYQHVSPASFYELALRSLATETDELNIQRILNYLTATYWRFLTHNERIQVAPELEVFLWEKLNAAPSTSLKVAFFNAYKEAVLTTQGTEQLHAIWNKSQSVDGLTFSERDFTSMAFELALRNEEAAGEILETQLERISNPDRQTRFAFIQPALSPDQGERDTFFASLKEVDNRSHEPWVLEALSYLNHPLRAEQSIHYLRPSLDLLEEIQRSGDIFFPQRWLGATLDGHQSPEAASIVQAFLDEHPNYPYRLKNKILQSADGLFRAAEIIQQ